LATPQRSGLGAKSVKSSRGGSKTPRVQRKSSVRRGESAPRLFYFQEKPLERGQGKGSGLHPSLLRSFRGPLNTSYGTDRIKTLLQGRLPITTIKRNGGTYLHSMSSALVTLPGDSWELEPEERIPRKRKKGGSPERESAGKTFTEGGASGIKRTRERFPAGKRVPSGLAAARSRINYRPKSKARSSTGNKGRGKTRRDIEKQNGLIKSPAVRQGKGPKGRDLITRISHRHH